MEESKSITLKGCGSAYNGCLMLQNREEDITSLIDIPFKLHPCDLTIACGFRHCIAFYKNDESKRCYLWGEHMVADSESEQIILEPIEISTSFIISEVACGFDHTLMLDSEKLRVFGFGMNQNS